MTIWKVSSARVMRARYARVAVVAVPGHRMTVSHADGRSVEPVVMDSLILGMGERYDVIVEADQRVDPDGCSS